MNISVIYMNYYPKVTVVIKQGSPVKYTLFKLIRFILSLKSNKLGSSIRNSESLDIVKKRILQFIGPSVNSA